MQSSPWTACRTVGSGCKWGVGVSAAAACSSWIVSNYNTVHSLINCAVENKNHCDPSSVVHSYHVTSTRWVIRRDAFQGGVEWNHLHCSCCSVLIHVTMNVCSVFAVKWCLGVGGLRRTPIRDITRTASDGKQGQNKRQCPVAVWHLNDLHT